MTARRWPAEWEPHSGTVFVWPWDGRIWGDAHRSAKQAIAKAAAVVSRGERVYMVVDPRASDSVPLSVAQAGGDLGQLEAIEAPTDDVWVRDSGPTFVEDRDGLVAVDWNFSAWGRKFPHSNDALLARRVAKHLRAEVESSSLTIEGGALETNGAGVLLTTRSVALNGNRNPRLTEAHVEAELKSRSGANEVVWLEAGFSNDDTDGHIDTLARFVSPETVMFQAFPPGQQSLEARNLAALEAAGLAPVRLPNPGLSGVPASYANFYFANAAVLVPQYGSERDEEALALIASHVDRPVEAVDCAGLITQGGAIHCATQQVPARRPSGG